VLEADPATSELVDRLVDSGTTKVRIVNVAGW
jgi:hypothetical protein